MYLPMGWGGGGGDKEATATLVGTFDRFCTLDNKFSVASSGS